MMDKLNTNMTVRMLLVGVWATVLCTVISSIKGSLTFVALGMILFIPFTSIGHVLVYPIFYKHGRYFEGFVWGSVLGVALSSCVVSVIVYLFSWNMPVIFIVICLLPTIIIAILFLWNKRFDRDETNPMSRRWWIYLAFLSIVTSFYYLPFRNIGYLVGDKHVYAWLFGHDFINRLVHVLSLSRGIPLQSYYFSGETLSYYWLSYIFPAFLYNVKSLSIDITTAMKISLLLYGLMMYSALFLLLNYLCKETTHIIWGLLLSFVGYSYSYAYLVVRYFGEKLLEGASVPFFGLKLGNFTGFSHSYYRFFLVEPQATVGIGLVLLLLLLFTHPRGIFSDILLGICLGLLFGVEATLGIMLLAAGGLYYSYRLVCRKEGREETLISAAISCCAAAFFYVIFFAIDMYDFKTGSGALKLHLNLFPIITGPFYFIIAYGPSVILGVLGIALYVKDRRANNEALKNFLLIVMAVAFFFVFFIVNPVEGNFGLLKATRLIPICLIVFCIYYMEKLPRSPLLKYGLPILVMLAVPSFFTDSIIASDVQAKGSTFIRAADLRACRWIRENTPPGAILQAEPEYPGNQEPYLHVYSYSLIPIFAERPTAIGSWKVSSVEHAKPGEVRERYHAIRRMFGTRDPDEALRILYKYKIGYVYISRLEEFLYPEGVSKFYNNERMFVPVFSQDGVEIFRVTND